MKAILHDASSTVDHFPSIAETEKIATKLNFVGENSWKYFDGPDCFVCGGPGWHYVLRKDGGYGVVACDDCSAGKNLQIGPKGNIKHTAKQCGEVAYHMPGRGGNHEQTHMSIIEQFGSLEAMADALANGHSTGEISKAFMRHFSAVKRAPSNTDNPNHDRELKF